MKTIKDNIPLCEIPEWGCGWSRCEYIGFRMIDGYAGPYLCLKYNEEELSSTKDGWLKRCDVCANGGYSPKRKAEEIEKSKDLNPRATKKLKPALVYRDIAEMPKELCFESSILWALEVSRGPVSKSQLFKVLSSLDYPGYIDSRFVNFTHRLREAFETLISEGFITYIKGKPVEVVYLEYVWPSKVE